MPYDLILLCTLLPSFQNVRFYCFPSGKYKRCYCYYSALTVLTLHGLKIMQGITPPPPSPYRNDEKSPMVNDIYLLFPESLQNHNASARMVTFHKHQLKEEIVTIEAIYLQNVS